MSKGPEFATRVYSQPGCMPCLAVIRALTRLGVPHTVVDVTQDSTALDTVRGYGFTSTPVVEVRRAETGAVVAAWYGVRDDAMRQIKNNTISSLQDMRVK